jgi:hypothetical protein
MSDYKNNYIFWFDDLTVLYKDDNYTKFIPVAGTSRIEQLNAIARFCIYSIFLLFIFGRLNSWLYIPIIGIIFTVVLYNIYLSDPDGRRKELFNERANKYADMLEDDTLINPDEGVDYEIESGYYDTEGKLHIAKDYDSIVQKKPLYYSPDELLTYQKNTCTKPTLTNPLMNVPTTMLNTPNNVAACNAYDEDIKNEITNLIDADLYKDVTDLFSVKNSQRQFYTAPSTSIPSNREDFQNFLYRIDQTCKEDSVNCLRQTDLRFQR